MRVDKDTASYSCRKLMASLSYQLYKEVERKSPDLKENSKLPIHFGKSSSSSRTRLSMAHGKEKGSFYIIYRCEFLCGPSFTITASSL